MSRTGSFAGAPALVRLAVRRDRVMVAVVLAVAVLLVYGSVAATLDLFPTAADLVATNAAANANAASVALYGRVHVLDGPGISAGKTRTILELTVAFLVIAIVRRHTRADEETGRSDLLGGTVVTRRAPLAAGVGLASAVSVLTGLLTALASVAGGWDAAGSLCLGGAVAGVGLAFTGITAVAMQAFAAAGSCSSLVYGLLAGTFALRMVGDSAGAEWLGWFSPFGWSELSRPLDGDRWWALLVPVVCWLMCVVAADRLLAARDVGAGLVASRPGPVRGRLGSPEGLAWRLQRGGVSGWLVGTVLFGGLVGVLLESVGDFLTPQAMEFLRRMGGEGTLADLYLTVIGTTFGLILAGFGLSMLLRSRAEEAAGHLEYLLATRVGRVRALVPYLAASFGGTLVLALATGFAVSFAHAATAGDLGRVWRDAESSLAHLPAVWVLLGLAVSLIGWAPRIAVPTSWALLAASALVGQMAPLLHAPDWVARTSPFAHSPKVPVEPMDWTPVVVMVIVALALTTVGVVGYRRRDMPA